ncbi:hypothetical protein HDU81_001143, partial [Chytriomyces hyalinus]
VDLPKLSGNEILRNPMEIYTDTIRDHQILAEFVAGAEIFTGKMVDSGMVDVLALHRDWPRPPFQVSLTILNYED